MKRGPPKAAASIALFPFLAVLLCTMGGLIVLLVVIARHAKEQARHHSKASLAQVEELETRRDDLRWRNDHLRASRDATAEQLGQRRLELSHLEDHARRLRDQLGDLQRALADFEKHAADKQHSRNQVRERLNELETQIHSAKEELEAQKRKVHPKSDSYAIVPYEGPNQTRRRPIYLECRAESVIVQPEGITLLASDFVGPSGPGNPLAASLRAVREYLQTNQGTPDAEHGEPYPLLLVRPDGINSYYKAREAMTSWGSEFGYEFIDADWKIEFKPPDPGLAVTLARTVDDARRRQLALAIAAPRLLTSEERSHFRSASGGRGGPSGVTMAGGASGGTGRQGSALGRHRGGRHGNDDDDNPGGSGGAPGFGARNHADNPALVDDLANIYGNTGSSGGENGSATANGGQGVSGASSEQASAGQAGASSAAGGQTTAPATSGAGAPAANTGKRSKYSGPSSTTGQPRANDTATDPKKKPFETTGKSYGRGRPNDPGAGQGQPPAEEVRSTKSSMAQSRGKDWSLPEGHHAATPVTRPIHLRCFSDRLELMDESAGEEFKSIPLAGYTQESVDRLVRNIQQRIESWGLAGRNMYWRPTLIVEVAPDGRGRYADLRELLSDSGLDLREKTVGNPAVISVQQPTQVR